MKILFTFIIVFLISISSPNSAEFSSLFGIKLLINVENYFNIDVIERTKYKNDTTIENFFDVEVTNIITKKSPQINNYVVTIDNDGTIHSISGYKLVDSVSNCLEKTLPSILSIFEKKYSLNFEYEESNSTFANAYQYGTWTKDSNILRLICNQDIESGSVWFTVNYESLVLIEEINKYYDSGF